MQFVKLMGGLGNQMFQYAFAKALPDKNIWFFGDYGRHHPRKLELIYFNCKFKYIRRSIYENFSFIFNLINKVEQKNSKIYEPELINAVKKHNQYIGFFQSEMYFKHIRNQLLNDFTIKEPLDSKNQEIISKMQSSNSVSVHIRRTDYLTVKETFGETDLEYFKNAIKYISEKIENPEFYFFSDDMDYVKENFQNLDFPHHFVDINRGDDSFKDMILMKNCKHNIITNSTFSWWGAWLNENPKKIVITPKKWCVNEVDGNDIIPEDWVKLPTSI